jgi:23S rRNA (pseudouridine1915-N3)-methyltransferase
MNISILSFSKTKDENILSLESKFLKRSLGLKIKIHENLPQGSEARSLSFLRDFQKKHQAIFFPLEERGEELSTNQFCQFLEKKSQGDCNHMAFILGSAEGLPLSISSLGKTISLSKLTFPHQWARLLLIEQLYRYQCHLKNHPYLK